MLSLFRRPSPVQRLQEIAHDISKAKSPYMAFLGRRQEMRDLYHRFNNQEERPTHVEVLNLLGTTSNIIGLVSGGSSLRTVDPESVRQSIPEVINFLDDNRGPIQRCMLRVAESYIDYEDFKNFPPADLFPAEMGYILSRLMPEPLKLLSMLDKLTFMGNYPSAFVHHNRTALYHAGEALLTNHPKLFVSKDFAFKWLKAKDADNHYDAETLVDKNMDQIIRGFQQLYSEDSSNFYAQLEKFMSQFPLLASEKTLKELKEKYEHQSIENCFAALEEQQAIKNGQPPNLSLTFNLHDAFKTVSGIIEIREQSFGCLFNRSAIQAGDVEYQPLEGVFVFSGGPDRETRLVAMKRPEKPDLTSGKPRSIFILERSGRILSATDAWDDMMTYAAATQAVWPQPHHLRVIAESFRLE